jgi:hypothetical protein
MTTLYTHEDRDGDEVELELDMGELFLHVNSKSDEFTTSALIEDEAQARGLASALGAHFGYEVLFRPVTHDPVTFTGEGDSMLVFELLESEHTFVLLIRGTGNTSGLDARAAHMLKGFITHVSSGQVFSRFGVMLDGFGGTSLLELEVDHTHVTLKLGGSKPVQAHVSELDELIPLIERGLFDLAHKEEK